jgi:hypothetical protein
MDLTREILSNIIGQHEYSAVQQLEGLQTTTKQNNTNELTEIQEQNPTTTTTSTTISLKKVAPKSLALYVTHIYEELIEKPWQGNNFVFTSEAEMIICKGNGKNGHMIVKTTFENEDEASTTQSSTISIDISSIIKQASHMDLSFDEQFLAICNDSGHVVLLALSKSFELKLPCIEQQYLINPVRSQVQHNFHVKFITNKVLVVYEFPIAAINSDISFNYHYEITTTHATVIDITSRNLLAINVRPDFNIFTCQPQPETGFGLVQLNGYDDRTSRICIYDFTKGLETCIMPDLEQALNKKNIQKPATITAEDSFYPFFVNKLDWTIGANIHRVSWISKNLIACSINYRLSVTDNNKPSILKIFSLLENKWLEPVLGFPTVILDLKCSVDGQIIVCANQFKNIQTGKVCCRLTFCSVPSLKIIQVKDCEIHFPSITTVTTTYNNNNNNINNSETKCFLYNLCHLTFSPCSRYLVVKLYGTNNFLGTNPIKMESIQVFSVR